MKNKKKTHEKEYDSVDDNIEMRNELSRPEHKSKSENKFGNGNFDNSGNFGNREKKNYDDTIVSSIDQDKIKNLEEKLVGISNIDLLEVLLVRSMAKDNSNPTVYYNVKKALEQLSLKPIKKPFNKPKFNSFNAKFNKFGNGTNNGFNNGSNNNHNNGYNKHNNNHTNDSNDGVENEPKQNRHQRTYY